MKSRTKIGLAGLGLIGLLNTSCSPLATLGAGYLVSEQMMLDRQQRAQQYPQQQTISGNSSVPRVETSSQSTEIITTYRDFLDDLNNDGMVDKCPYVIYGERGISSSNSQDYGFNFEEIPIFLRWGELLPAKYLF